MYQKEKRKGFEKRSIGTFSGLQLSRRLKKIRLVTVTMIYQLFADPDIANQCFSKNPYEASSMYSTEKFNGGAQSSMRKHVKKLKRLKQE